MFLNTVFYDCLTQVFLSRFVPVHPVDQINVVYFISNRFLCFYEGVEGIFYSFLYTFYDPTETFECTRFAIIPYEIGREIYSYSGYNLIFNLNALFSLFVLCENILARFYFSYVICDSYFFPPLSPAPNQFNLNKYSFLFSNTCFMQFLSFRSIVNIYYTENNCA